VDTRSPSFLLWPRTDLETLHTTLPCLSGKADPRIYAKLALVSGGGKVRAGENVMKSSDAYDPTR
jgi:hypothetical protein